MRKTRLIALLIIGIFFFSITTIAEEITLTTYYPAPYGEYQQLYVSGNVGIGTTSPVEKFHLYVSAAATQDATVRLQVEPASGRAAYLKLDSGNIDFGGIEYRADGSQRWAIGDFDVNADGHLVVYTGTGSLAPRMTIRADTGNVGIGTTNPQDLLHVNNATGLARIRVSSGNSTTQFVQYPTGAGAFWDNGTTGLPSYFRVSNASLLDTTAMTILSNGYVGIGTTNPTQALDINGRIRVRNNVGGQILGVVGDIAEYIAVSEDVSFLLGDVVVVDKENSRRVTKSTRPYDPLVAGVISSKDQAAMIIGSEEPKKQLLSLAGQVLVKVTLEGGAIQSGDLLTTSSTPGHAMKATDREKSFGAIVGKALEPFDGGPNGEKTGKIMVLVTLQ